MDKDDRADVVVFGATGFTGEVVVEYMATRMPADERKGLRWAIAGRSEPKLLDIKKKYGLGADVAVLVADSHDEKSLDEMCRQHRVVINCTGPFRFYGESVVRACLRHKTNYVDITGEPEFIERMMLKYDKEARAKGIFIVSACGFDSVPADLGTVFAANEFKKSVPGGVMSSVDIYMDHEAKKGFSFNSTTLESAIHGIQSADELRKLRKALRAEQTDNGRIEVARVGRRPATISKPHKHKDVKKYAIPMFFADPSVIANTQLILSRNAAEKSPDKKTPSFPYINAYVTVGSLCYMIVLTFFALIMKMFMMCACGRRLIVKHPRLFTAGMFARGGSTKDERENTLWFVRFFAKGYSDANNTAGKPDRVMTASVSGVDLPYTGCAICAVLAALVILQERASIPFPGGVLTPGSCFAETRLVERLTAAGVRFAVDVPPKAVL